MADEIRAVGRRRAVTVTDVAAVDTAATELAGPDSDNMAGPSPLIDGGMVYR
ncbi:MAG TPA: hypothetical protein VHQ45_14325 [Gemmatimonadaceae bacterium]|nr:hypothetical protein [Gemmatimonadaceae bacterium]